MKLFKLFFMLLAAASWLGAAPILPEKDPEATGAQVKLLEKMQGKHPRLLLTAERLPQLRAYYNSGKAADYRKQFESKLPECVVPSDRKTSPAWGQEMGLFRMPTLALHYLMTGDKKSLAGCKEFLQWLAGTANWTEGGEPVIENTPEAYAKVMEKLLKMKPANENNSDTTAAFTMVGAALVWDWIYDDLEPAFREQFRQVLWQHARAMYYGGHLARNPGGNYWRGVPMYNHRWFRDWGMTLAAVAATEGKPDEQWLLGKLRGELQFMADWLAPDGSQHEGPGYGSSSGALGLTFQVSDECFGTKHLEAPFFRNVSMFALQESAPGMKEAFYFADCFTKANSIHPFYLKTASYFKQADLMDGVRQYLKSLENQWGVKDYAWLSLLCDDPGLEGGQYTKLPATYFFPDLGITILREAWKDNAVAAMFKCGPPGGYKLNSWRPVKQAEDGKFPYINVAHDHPDANSFTILGDGSYLAETNRYPLKPGKLSAGNNTVLVNGLGQTPKGRPEGDEWWQPSNDDMTKMGVITAWKDAGEVVVSEGEASGSYEVYRDPGTKKSRPALDRFRRSFVWVKGGYILVLDDIRAPEPVEITWLMQGAKLAAVDEGKNIYSLSKNNGHCDFQLLSDSEFKAVIGVSTANDHSKLLNWQQLQATAAAKTAVRFVSVYNPWHNEELKLTFAPENAEKAVITVSGKGFTDSWKWEAGKGKFEASTLQGNRSGGFEVLINSKNSVPPAQ